MQPILPYIMQNQPDIENGMIHVNMNAHEDLGKMHQRITKLENAVAKLNKFVDTSCSGACATFCASVVRLGLDLLCIWVAVKVLS